jgi:hypothetical protein
MVRRRSTVRFRKGALVDKQIRTAEQGLGAIPGANRALEWNTSTGEALHLLRQPDFAIFLPWS